MVLLAAASATCGAKKLPAGPDTIQAGLVVYEHANYEGRSALITQSLSDLEEFSGPCDHSDGSSYGSSPDWNDCISSIRIAPGWRATVYTGPDFKGNSLTVIADQPNLQLATGDCDHDGMNDCISSISLLPMP